MADGRTRLETPEDREQNTRSQERAAERDSINAKNKDIWTGLDNYLLFLHQPQKTKKNILPR